MDTELVEITLNYKGEDYQAICDIETANILLNDRPSPPGKPQLITENEATPDLITIRWNKPSKDGGSPISGYLVEHRRTGSPHWVRATPLMVPFPELTVSGLEPGWRYQFRVSAENAVGLSDPGELSEPITVTLQRSAVTAPRFTQEFQDATALENEKVEFAVHFLGQPAPKVCWFKDGFEIFSSRRIRILTEHDKSILTIHQSALGDEGEIKCTATNRAGHVSTKAKLSLEAPPAIRLPRQYEEGLLFEIGEMIRLKVQVAGRPTPLVFWCHNGESIQSNDRYELEYDDKCSILKINEARRSDRGEYQIKAVNKLGDDHASFLVTVTDKPSPPGKARVVMTLGRSVTLQWSLPNDDGGCKIGNYIVEYYRVGWNVWLKAATSRQLTTMLGDLIEGSEYKFRIKAESPYGISDPSEETDVVFIPDPKRGITQPNARGRSQPRDILDDISAPVAAKRKNKPRSQSSGRAEEEPQLDYGIQTSISNANIPKRPDRLKIKSPPKTPDSSPITPRKDTNINRAIFDRSSMARDLAYGSPEIKVKKELNVPDYILNYSSQSDKSKSPSPVRRLSESEQDAGRSRSVSFSSQKSRSMSPAPSPLPARTKSPREIHDHFTGSSEFMLVLQPEENEKVAGIPSDFQFDFDEDSVPPPMSLSAPELSKETPEMLYSLRNSASSTELLHERALMRFYQAAEAEEAELERKRTVGDKKRNSLDIPKIQINSRDNQKVVGLEKKHSLRRKSAGITHEQALMVQRRQSLRSPNELKEILPPQNNLYKYTPEDKRELMMLRQRSESEEKEEEEFKKIRLKMQDKVKFEKKVVRVADMEKWSDDYEESTDEENYEDEDDEDIESSIDSKSRETVYHLYDFSDSEDEPYHPSGMANLKDNEPFEILTKKKNPPDPNFKPKPILKKTEHEENIQYNLLQSETKKKKKRSHSPMPPDAVNRGRSQSLVEQLLDPLTEKMFRNKKNGDKDKKDIQTRQRSFSLIPKNEKLQSLEKITEDKEDRSPTHNIKSATAFSTIAAAGIIIPQKLLDKKQDNEEAKVVVDHYSDMIRTASLKKKVNPPPKVQYETETLYTVMECTEPSIESQLQTAQVIDIIIPKPVTVEPPQQKFFSRREITNEKEQPKRKVSASPMRKSKRTPSQSPGRRASLTRNRSKSKSPVRNENWSTLRTPPEKPKRKTSPSPMRKDIKKKSSPHLNRRTISRSPSPSPSRSRTNSYSHHRPLLREIMTQTSVGLESFSDDSITPLKQLKQEQLIAQAETKVKSVMDYITDLSMFMVACWLYLFKNELFAIPVLVVMIYRQLTDEIKRRMPKRWLPLWISKRFTRKKL